MPGARFTLVRLIALWSTLERRIRGRELGSGLERQFEHTAKQVSDMETDQRPEVHVLNTTGLTVQEAARRMLAIWRPGPTN